MRRDVGDDTLADLLRRLREDSSREIRDLRTGFSRIDGQLHRRRPHGQLFAHGRAGGGDNQPQCFEQEATDRYTVVRAGGVHYTGATSQPPQAHIAVENEDIR
ncbi:MAG: hypothetical protein QOH21_2463 [Acidobacteriota bacterium]|jgi:hypothetical protein|nr:hypothetical protein [Acidobacteriota bacterium]